MSCIVHIMQRYYENPRNNGHNCYTCKYYMKEENTCMHPEHGIVLSLFLDDPSQNCPFWEKLGAMEELYSEHGEGD